MKAGWGCGVKGSGGPTLRRDPGEWRDLAGHWREHADELGDELDSYLRRIEAKQPVANREHGKRASAR